MLLVHVAGMGFGASGFLLFLSYALLFWFGSTLIEDGEVTFQEMMQAIMCLMLGTMGLGQALNDLADQNAGLQAAYRVFMAIDEAASCSIDGLSRKGATLESVKGRIELRNVAFAYPSRPDVTVCKGYSLVIEPGQVVALVGPSGSGKSTIMNLLLRFYDPQEGEVLLDGAEVRGLSVRWLRDQIGYVGQEPTLFSGSVAENIAKGRRQGTADGPAVTVAPRDLESAGVGGVDADIVDATTVSNAHGFISAFPKGYDTDVGEGSVMVSGGQKQRIAIARALVRKPAVLLLDEATSALDTESEQLIQAAIDKLQETRAQTTIIIAHRLSTIKNADKIAVLDAGQVVEMGTHDELVGKEGGLYAKLWARQTGEK
jgi:ATP-binding cassette, subfamily B (MDR/TAP), member 1